MKLYKWLNKKIDINPLMFAVLINVTWVTIVGISMIKKEERMHYQNARPTVIEGQVVRLHDGRQLTVLSKDGYVNSINYFTMRDASGVVVKQVFETDVAEIVVAAPIPTIQ